MSVAARVVRQQRSVHYVPQLRHDFNEGVPGLLSADGYDMAWTQYMTLMIDKLNALTAGSSRSSSPRSPCTSMQRTYLPRSSQRGMTCHTPIEPWRKTEG